MHARNRPISFARLSGADSCHSGYWRCSWGRKGERGGVLSRYPPAFRVKDPPWKVTMPKPIRVLHIVGAMNHGGVETWLMALLRHANRAEIAMDFLVHTSQPAAYDTEIAALGGRIIPCPAIHRLIYVQDFDCALRRHGPYDVLHSHVHYFSGLTTTLARGRGVRLRIAHSHSDTTV